MGVRREPTLSDVAAEASVSAALASLALRGLPGPSEASRRAVLEAASRIGYHANVPARLLARTRTRTIGVVYNVHEQFESQVVENLYGYADAHGYDLFLGARTNRRSLLDAISPLVSGICEGLILVGVGEVPQDVRERIQVLPTVIIGHPPRCDSYDIVKSADIDGMNKAVDFLVQLGHSRISHIDGGSASGAVERRSGYSQAMVDHGLTSHIEVVTGGSTSLAGSQAMERILDGSSQATAVVAYDDTCAWGALRAMEAHGVSIPEEMSIIGYDDDIVSRDEYLNLTTVAQDVDSLCRIAFERLLHVISSDDVAKKEFLVSPTLIVRGSAASPNGRPRNMPMT